MEKRKGLQMSENILIQNIERILFEEQLKGEMKISVTANRIYCLFINYEKVKKNHEKSDCICTDNNII